MEFLVSLSDDESRLLQRLAASWNVSPDEVIRTTIRTHFAAFASLRNAPAIEMSVTTANEILLHAVWNESGTYNQLRHGTDPGSQRIQGLATALHVLWRHYRNEDAIPTSVCHAAASIIHFYADARLNTASLRSDLSTELINLSVRAYQLLSGAVADSDFQLVDSD